MKTYYSNVKHHACLCPFCMLERSFSYLTLLGFLAGVWLFLVVLDGVDEITALLTPIPDKKEEEPKDE